MRFPQARDFCRAARNTLRGRTPGQPRPVKRVYPEEYIRDVPPWLHAATPPASPAELRVADDLRRVFCFPGEPAPYLVDIVRAFRLLRGARIYIEVGTWDKGNLAYASRLLSSDADIVDVDLQARPTETKRIQAHLQPKQRLHTIVGTRPPRQRSSVSVRYSPIVRRMPFSSTATMRPTRRWRTTPRMLRWSDRADSSCSMMSTGRGITIRSAARWPRTASTVIPHSGSCSWTIRSTDSYPHSPSTRWCGVASGSSNGSNATLLVHRHPASSGAPVAQPVAGAVHTHDALDP